MKFFNSKKSSSGFTLVEMLVSVAIFTFVMLMTTASIFTVVAVDKKAESLKSVMDNLSFALESMTRDIRTGSGYNCGTESGGDCPSGGSAFYFTSNQSDGAEMEYYLSNGQIMEDQTGWENPLPITAAEINVTSLEFYLVGSAAHDGLQPRVLMSVIGTAGTTTTETEFRIQTTLSQRQIDS